MGAPLMEGGVADDVQQVWDVGLHAQHVELPEEIGPALRRAFASGKTALIDVAVDPAAVWPIPTAGRASALMGY